MFQCGSSSEHKPKSAMQCHLLSQKLEQLSREKRHVTLTLNLLFVFNRSAWLAEWLILTKILYNEILKTQTNKNHNVVRTVTSLEIIQMSLQKIVGS